MIAFVICILGLSLVSGHRNHGNHHRRHHERHHWHRHIPFVNFEVHDPKGLTVSMVQRSPNTTFFGIELFVNKAPNRFNETHCDVCQNTTTITYGKFIIEDDEVVIKKGDILYYHVLLGDSSNVTRLFLQRLWVTDSIIDKCNCEVTSQIPDVDLRFGQPTGKPDRRPSFGVKPDTVTDFPADIDEGENAVYPNENTLFECEVDPATNLCRTTKSEKLTSPESDLEREVQILEAIVEKMRKSCESRRTTNLVRLEKFDADISDSEQLMNFVRSSFSINPEMQHLTANIRRVFPDREPPRAILLEMSSYVAKQKVLYHAQLNNLKHIGDYDSRRFGKAGRRG